MINAGMRHEARGASRRLRSFAFLLLPFALSCSMPIRSEDMPELVRALAESNASACLVTGVSGGGGAIPIGPMPTVPGGGWGKADFTFCRSNEPGSEISVNDTGITIKHGMAIAKELAERIDTLESAVKLMLQRMIDAAAPETKPGAMF